MVARAWSGLMCRETQGTRGGWRTLVLDGVAESLAHSRLHSTYVSEVPRWTCRWRRSASQCIPDGRSGRNVGMGTGPADMPEVRRGGRRPGLKNTGRSAGRVGALGWSSGETLIPHFDRISVSCKIGDRSAFKQLVSRVLADVHATTPTSHAEPASVTLARAAELLRKDHKGDTAAVARALGSEGVTWSWQLELLESGGVEGSRRIHWVTNGRTCIAVWQSAPSGLSEDRSVVYQCGGDSFFKPARRSTEGAASIPVASSRWGFWGVGAVSRLVREVDLCLHETDAKRRAMRGVCMCARLGAFLCLCACTCACV
jgi:hypothetical protein